jgi:hypothetical protein
MLIFSPQRLSETFLNQGIAERDIAMNVHWSPCAVPIILVRF